MAHADSIDRKQLDRLMAAAETYVVAVVRHALSPQDTIAAVNAGNTVRNARAALLDAIDQIDRERG